MPSGESEEQVPGGGGEEADGEVYVYQIFPRTQENIDPESWNTTKWKGTLKDDYGTRSWADLFRPIGGDRFEPYCNHHVCQFGDRVRGTIQLTAWLISLLSYHLSPYRDYFLAPLASFSAGPSESSASANDGAFDAGALVTAIFAILSDVLLWADYVIILSMVFSIKRSEQNMFYKVMAKLHNAWHAGKAPFAPLDTRSEIFQKLYLFGSWGAANAAGQLVMSFVISDPMPRVVFSQGFKLLNAIMFLGNYGRNGCYSRGLSAFITMHGKLEPLPIRWNGIQVEQICYSASGPVLKWEPDGEVRYIPDKDQPPDKPPGYAFIKDERAMPRVMAVFHLTIPITFLVNSLSYGHLPIYYWIGVGVLVFFWLLTQVPFAAYIQKSCEINYKRAQARQMVTEPQAERVDV